MRNKEPQWAKITSWSGKTKASRVVGTCRVLNSLVYSIEFKKKKKTEMIKWLYLQGDNKSGISSMEKTRSNHKGLRNQWKPVDNGINS